MINLAAELATRHEVEILSVRRTREKPFFPVPDRVGMRWLIDPARAGGTCCRAAACGSRWSSGGRCAGCAATCSSPPGPRSPCRPRGTRPRAWSASPGSGTRPATPGPIRRHYPRLSAVVASTERTREEWRHALDHAVPVHHIPDALPPDPLPRSRLDNRIVSAGGRWVPVKGFDRLIQAFAIVADKRPDWRLRLYGGGSEEKRLRNLVGRLGLHNHVLFMGTTPDLPGEFAKASVVAVPSLAETPGMTVIEALGCGVPVLGFAGRRGPQDFLTSGRDGVLVPEGDGEIEAYASALLALIDDERRRRALAAGALGTARGLRRPRGGRPVGTGFSPTCALKYG